MKNKRILKLVGSVLMVVVLTLTLASAIGCTGEQEEEEEESYEIGVFQIAIHPALDAAREGFKDALTEAIEAEGATVTFNEQEAAGEPTNAATIAQSFVAEGVDLIFAIATDCVQAAALAVEGTDIPVVFSAVTNPVVAGVCDSWEEPGGQVTGASDIAPVDPQLQLILDIFADETNENELNTLGVMYNPGEINSVYQVDIQLPEAIALLGLDISMEESPAYDTAEVSAAAQALVGKVDAIWVPTDNTIVTAFEAVVAVAEDNDIPLFASDVATIERGAIGCWGLNYYDNGYVAGEMAAEILLEGADPGEMQVERTPAEELWVNPGAAEEMGITIPQSVVDMATYVIE
jgi:putative ABC transport system substrate-binding protein